MFKHMKLGTKIITGFSLLIVIACALGGVAVWQMRGIQAETTTSPRSSCRRSRSPTTSSAIR